MPWEPALVLLGRLCAFAAGWVLRGLYEDCELRDVLAELNARRRWRRRYSPRVSERPAQGPGLLDGIAMDFDDDWPPVREPRGEVVEFARHQ